MKQALHIFRKDARRFWPQIAVVWLLFAIYSVTHKQDNGLGITLATPETLIALACWILGANVIHEEALSEESPFWITRPYSRMSLFAAKTLFLFTFVFLPLLVSGIVVEARNGVNVMANAGTLLADDLLIALWLILPAIAIGVVTVNLKSFAAGVGILYIAFYAIVRWHFIHLDASAIIPTVSLSNAASDLPMVLAAIAVVGLQYAARRTTQWSRGALIAAVIASAFLMPLRSVAEFSARALNPGFDPTRIHVALDESQPVQMEYGVRWRGTCFSMALRVEGLPEGTVLRQLDAPGKITSEPAGPRDLTAATLGETARGYREIVCAEGPFTAFPESIHAVLNLSVFSVKTIAQMPARPGTFTAGNAGRCEVGLIPFPENTQLRCDLEQPVRGSIFAGLEFPGYKDYSDSFFRNTGSLQLSPVSQQKFDGSSSDKITPGGWPFETAFNRPDAHFVFRTERFIGSLERDVIYHQVMFPWTRIPVPKAAGK